MATPKLLLGYLLVLLGTLIIAIVYTEFRQRRFKPTPSQDRIFRCTKCGLIYTDDPDVDRSRCVQCGQLNEAIEF
jgi:DNA-directed RNA polymerase subunit RPC12/RpoP